MELRCYAHDLGDGRAIAECIDLDIVVQGRDMDEVVGKLNDAIFGYLEVALKGGDDRALIPRPSPLWNRLRYGLAVARSRFSTGTVRLFTVSPANLLQFQH